MSPQILFESGQVRKLVASFGGFPYRLVISNGPHVENVFPRAVQLGQSNTLGVYGRNLGKDEADEQRAVEQEEVRHRRPFMTAFTVVFVAEWGDLTQLATAALQARYQQPVVVFVAATLALWAVSAIAVALGNRLGAWIPERPLQFAAAGVMVLVAIALISGLLG